MNGPERVPSASLVDAVHERVLGQPSIARALVPDALDALVREVAPLLPPAEVAGRSVAPRSAVARSAVVERCMDVFPRRGVRLWRRLRGGMPRPDERLPRLPSSP